MKLNNIQDKITFCLPMKTERVLTWMHSKLICAGGENPLKKFSVVDSSWHAGVIDVCLFSKDE